MSQVYVIDLNGNPLMPTTRCGHVRRMLKGGEAKVFQREPFTIQLLYETTDFVQDIDLGIDAGSKTIGVSACTEKEEVYAAEVENRTDVTKNLSERRQFRRSDGTGKGDTENPDSRTESGPNTKDGWPHPWKTRS